MLSNVLLLKQALFLVLLLLFGIVVSVILIATILSSLTLRRFPFNLMLMHIGLVCLLECSLNIT